MSADLLREAAGLMRERAEAATSGPWQVLDSIHRDPYVVQKGRGVLSGGCIALASGDDYGKGNSEHIAGMHPAVALAVADLLDHTAEADEKHREALGRGIAEGRMSRAVAVAAAYLGSE